MRWTAVIYILIAFVHLAFIYIDGGISESSAVSKVLLMPVLMVMVFSTPFKRSFLTEKFILLAALLFSWLGDILLLDLLEKDDFFIFGLSSFLITQILYFTLFNRTAGIHRIFMDKRKLVAALVVLLWVGLVFNDLYPGLGDYLIPVSVYVAMISLMALASINRLDRVNFKSFLWVFSGAVFFMASDMFIAMSRFIAPFSLDRLIIMGTYIIAQFLIVEGLLEQYRREV